MKSPSLIARLLDLEKRITQQLNIILHASAFQKLEASWLGLKKMVEDACTLQNSAIRIRFLDASLLQITKDFSQSYEYTHTQLFQKLYHEELKRAGGEPLGVLLCDYDLFSRNIVEAVFVLRYFAEIGAAIFAPFIFGIYSQFFEIENIANLHQQYHLDHIFQQPAYAAWQALRENPLSQFIGMVLPRVLMRDPYHARLLDTFTFAETIHALSDYAWGSSVYFYATSLLRTFANTGWFLQPPTSRPDATPFEINLTPHFTAAFETLGCIAIVAHRYAQGANIYKTHSICTNAQTLSLNEVYCAARFIHYLQAIGRLHIGKTIHITDLENDLQNWLLQYCATPQEYTEETMYQYPLRFAKVKIVENHFSWKQFYCRIHLVLQKPLQHLIAHIQWMTELEMHS